MTKKTNAEKWIDGEISLGKFIELSGLEGRFAGASDFAGSIANAYDARIKAAHNAIEAKRKRAETEQAAEEAAGDLMNATASAAAKRAYMEALSFLRSSCS